MEAFILSCTKPGNKTLHSADSVPNKNSSKLALCKDLESTSLQSTVKENPTSHSDMDTEYLNNLPEKPSVADKDVTALPILITHCDKCKKPRLACPDGLKKCTCCFKLHYCSMYVKVLIGTGIEYL